MMAEVVVRLDGGQEAVSAITASLVARLKLERGSRVSIVVRATEVMLMMPD